MPEIMEIGLTSIKELNGKVMNVPQISQPFFTTCYSGLVNEVLQVLTDCRHLSGFKLQCQILSQLILVIEQDVLSQPIQQQDGTPHQLPDNKTFAV